MASSLEGIDHTVQLTHDWINSLDQRIGWNDAAKSFRLLRATLHALREWLPINEGANLSAQLPTLLRGYYYEQWRPSKTPAKDRDKAHFLEMIEHGMKPDVLRHPDMSVGAVFALLAEKISPGEIADIRQSLPADIRKLWPT